MNVEKIGRFENFLFLLVIMAIFLPVGFQYMATGLVMLATLTHFVRRILRQQPRPTLSPAAGTWFQRLVWAGLLLFVAVFLNVLLSNLTTDYPRPWAKAGHDAWHLSGKLALWGAAMAATMRWAVLRGWTMGPWLTTLAAVVVIHTAYVILQRYTGVNWAQGFGAVLGDHRYSYGVYRISGFMGHPLSFAYNMVLFSCLSLTLLQSELGKKQKTKVALWVIFGCTVFTLLISGSRWPLLVLAATFGLFHVHFLIRWWRKALLVVVLVLSVLAVEGSFWGRVQELRETDTSLEQRFDRLVFWRVHWNIFQDHPVFGVGYSSRNLALPDYYEQLGYGTLERQYNAHNIFLQTMADSGILGLIILLSFLVTLATIPRHSDPPWLQRGIYMILAASILAGIMQNVFRDTVFIIGFWLCCLLMFSQAANEVTRKTPAHLTKAKAP